MGRSIALISACLLLLLALPSHATPVARGSFMKTPVNLTIKSAAGGPAIQKQTTPNKVREAVTKLHGEEKRMQVYLIQRFLADAKVNIKVAIDVEGDLYKLNNRLPQGQKSLNWVIILTNQEKVRALANFLDRNVVR